MNKSSRKVMSWSNLACLDAATAMVRRRVKSVSAPCVSARGVVVIGLKVRRLSTLVQAVERLLQWRLWRGREGFRRENGFLISFRRRCSSGESSSAPSSIFSLCWASRPCCRVAMACSASNPGSCSRPLGDVGSLALPGPR